MPSKLIIHSSGKVIDVKNIDGGLIEGLDFYTTEPVRLYGGAYKPITERELKRNDESLLSILKGHVKEFLNKDEQLSEERMAICKACPLFLETPLGAICNPNLYLKGEKVSTYPLEEYTRGCGCRLGAKTRLKEKHCPVNKW